MCATVPAGPESIAGSGGGAVSTVKARLAGLASALPAWSIARTSNVWAPSARAAIVSGELQAAKAPASTRHWKVAPGSLEKVKVGVASFVGPAGPESSVVWAQRCPP